MTLSFRVLFRKDRDDVKENIRRDASFVASRFEIFKIL